MKPGGTVAQPQPSACEARTLPEQARGSRHTRQNKGFFAQPVTVPVVERADFWRIVEDARADGGSDTERVAQVLLRRLRQLRPSEIEQ